MKDVFVSLSLFAFKTRKMVSKAGNTMADLELAGLLRKRIKAHG